MLKNLIRETLKILHLDLTKNMKYDRLTKSIIKKAVKPNSNCIDIGCHKGEILDVFLKYAPSGTHYAFEPIPVFYKLLNEKYKNRVKVFSYAISDKEETTNFHYVKNAPAFSGIKKRDYLIKNPVIQEIKVKAKPLDHIIPVDIAIDVIKIDVEGAEMHVLKGSQNTLTRNRPLVIFEYGKGASDYYGTDPGALYCLLENTGLNIYLLQDWLKQKKPLRKEKFINVYKENEEYYFVAGP